MPRILIDTDAGDDVDDVLAIAFAALRQELQIVAVTTVGWRPHDRAGLVRKVLAACGKPDVPVAVGYELPLTPQSDEERARYTSAAKTNHVDVVSDAERDALAPVNEEAVDLLIRQINAAPGELTIVAIGQLTNIAAALRRAPDLAQKVSAIALMGGEVELLRREHNVHTDVIAADEVFRSGARLFVGTWNVTRRFMLDANDCQRIAAHGSPLAALLTRCIEKWHPHQSWKPGPVMYDLAPVLWAMDPRHIETKPMRLAVELAGTYTRGLTMPIPGDPNAEVSVSLDPAAIRELYLQTLLPPHIAAMSAGARRSTV